MELPDNLPLAELKKAIKSFKTEQTPKLSSKKSVLADYAVRVGILKGKAAPEVPTKAVLEEALVKSAKAKKVNDLPEVLKAPVGKKGKPESKPEPKPEPKKKGSPFSAFMAENKGKGLSMTQLAEAYRKQRQ
jgi:hypothetical protein